MTPTPTRKSLLINLFFFLNGLVTITTITFAQPGSTISSLKLIGSYQIPYGLIYNNTTIGGLSGIDYDAAHKRYFFISDDRSAVNPARFYTAAISLSAKGIDSIHFTGVTSLLQPNGSVYPNNKQDPYHTPDPEAIRYNPLTSRLVWSSEGERTVNKKDTILENPMVAGIALNGKFLNNYQLPENLYMQSFDKGPRQNGVLEGLTFADHYQTLYVNVEEPLYEDGPMADIIENNALIRILQFNVANRKNTRQFAYPLDPVAHAPFPAGGFKINGVPDILWLGENKLLVIERSFSTGRLACTIKLFIADLNGATDIKSIASLKTNAPFIPVSKKLLLNMDNLGIYIDNIEGVTFGPNLPNGHKTLVFVSDNNFNPLEQTQLLLFEVIP
jgi:hypothetical protein